MNKEIIDMGIRQILWLLFHLQSLIVIITFVLTVYMFIKYKYLKRGDKIRNIQYMSSVGIFLSSFLPFIQFYGFVLAVDEMHGIYIPLNQTLSTILPRSIFSFIFILLFFLILIISAKMNKR